MNERIRKCANFKRELIRQYPFEVQYCTKSFSDMRCGGFSDACPTPKKFVAEDGSPREFVLFEAIKLDERTN